MGFWKWLTQIFNITKIEEDPMKYLIVGLGNMDPEYDHTRHNIGFEAVDALNERLGGTFEDARHGLISKCKYRGRTLWIHKPSTYMNLSGEAVRYWVQKQKIQSQNLLVVVDDIHLDLGKQRLRAKGSDAGHNGLKSIQQELGTNNFIRLRIGIGKDFYPGEQVNYVLGRWTPKEQEQLTTIVKRAAETILAFTTIGLQRTMNQYNG